MGRLLSLRNDFLESNLIFTPFNCLFCTRQTAHVESKRKRLLFGPSKCQLALESNGHWQPWKGTRTVVRPDDASISDCWIWTDPPNFSPPERGWLSSQTPLMDFASYCHRGSGRIVIVSLLC